MKRRAWFIALIPLTIAGLMLAALRADDPAREIGARLGGYERSDDSRTDAIGGVRKLRVTLTPYVVSRRSFEDEIARFRRDLPASRWIERAGSDGARVFQRSNDSELASLARQIPGVRNLVPLRTWSLRVEPWTLGRITATEILTETL